MEEHQVTSSGKQHAIEPPFYVLATQNPIEQEGTYPLPFAQLDRFMFQVHVDYPPRDEEYRILQYTTTGYSAELRARIDRDEILALQKIVRRLPVDDAVIRYAVDLARATRVRRESVSERVEEWLTWGVGPRGPYYLLIGGKTRAMLHGRTKVLPEDIRAIIHPTFRHRLILDFHAEAEGVSPDEAITQILAEVPSPDGWTPPQEEEASALQRMWERLRSGKATAPAAARP